MGPFRIELPELAFDLKDKDTGEIRKLNEDDGGVRFIAWAASCEDLPQYVQAARRWIEFGDPSAEDSEGSDSYE